MSTSAYGGNPDTSEGSSVDSIVAQPSVEQAPLQVTVDSNPSDEETLYQWFKDAQNSLPNIHVAPGNYNLSLHSVIEIEKLWEDSVAKKPMMEKMFQSAKGTSLPATTAAKSSRPKTKSLQRGLSFRVDPRKLVETYDKWHAFLKQLQERRRKIYRIVNDLHDHRLFEQTGVMDDIEQGFGQVQSDSKDLKQLQLEQTKIKDYPDRLKECQTVLEKVLSMPKPIMNTELVGSEDDEQILEHYLASFEQANQMLERCENLSEQFQILFSNLEHKINREIDEILFQIDELNDWLEDAYKLFLLKPTNLPYTDEYLLVNWQKKFTYVEIEYGDSSFLESTLLPGESSVDLDSSATMDWGQEAKHTAECILNMINDKLSEHKLEAMAHKLELCLARGNLIAMETDVTAQLSRIQFLWQHLKEYGDLRVAELNFAIKMEKTHELMSEGQDELINFEEEYYDLKIKTLEDEFTDFQAFFYEIEFFQSLEKIRDEMCECLEVYLSLCSCSTELKVNEDLLKGEVEDMKHEYEEMMLSVENQKMFFEEGLEKVKSLHEAIEKFQEWLTTTEEVVYRDFYGDSYQELCAYYDSVKSFLGDLIQQEEEFEALMIIANAILEHCSDEVEEELSGTMETLKDRWVNVSDIIVNLEINVYAIIELWAAYEQQYVKVQAFIDDMSNKIQKEPLESSDGDTSLLPKYKAVNDSIVEYRPQYEKLMNDLGRKLANHDKLNPANDDKRGTKDKIEADMDKLKMQWEQLNDNVTASIESLQQELADWFTTTYSQLESYVKIADQMLQQVFVVVSVDANFDDTLSDQLQSTYHLIHDHGAVFSEEKSQEFYELLDKVFGRRPPHHLDASETSVLDFEPLSHDDITKTEALQTSWNEKWELAKHYLILLKLRTKVLEYMAIIQDGQEFCSIQCDSDLESLETALHNYESKFTEEYFKSLQSQIEEMHHLAVEFTKSCPCDEERVPQGDSREAVFITLQESYDSLSSTVNEKCEVLQQHIELWHNYNDLKAAVSTIIEDVQGSVDKLNERSHDPAVPPTTIVDSANELKLEFESNAGKNQAFNAAKEKLAESLQEDAAAIDNQLTEEVIQISTDWHNLLLTLNQFVSQATQRSQEFIVFIEDINKLAIEISNLKSSVEREVDIELPERENDDYARRMIERRDMLEALQSKCKDYQEKRDQKISSGVSWQPTKVPAHLLVDFPSDFCPDDWTDGKDSDWLVHNYFDVLAEQMATMQAQLDKREDNLEQNEETVLIFKGLSNDLLKWLNHQLTLPVMNKLPDTNQEQLEEDISVLESLQEELEGKIENDKTELDDQHAKLEGRNLREDTRQEIQQIANAVNEAMTNIECKVADQLAKFNEAKFNLINFLDKSHAFEEWLNETEAELETCWPLGADLPLLIEKGIYINEKVKNAVDNKIALPNELLDTEESIKLLFDPASHHAISILPNRLKERYNLLVDDCEEKIEHIEDATNELQQFMVTYEKFMKWLEETLNTAISRSEVKHSVGVTESKLEEHKEFVTETIEVKVEEFEALKGNAVPLKEKYPPSDWLERKMKESCDQWDELWSCCDKHRKHLEWLLERWVTYEQTVSELLDWVMTEAESFAKEVTTRSDKGVVDHIKSCEELHASLEEKNMVMGQVIEMSEQLAEYDVRKENGTDDISSRKNDVVQHWDSLINLLAETLLRLEATYAELRHVLQVLEEESDLIGGLETRAALPPTCHGNTDILSQQIEHFQAVLVETESHNEKVAYLNGYLDFVEEHSCKDDREPQQQEIKDVVARHTALLEQSSRVLTVGRQALPVWQEYNDTTTKLSEWMMECHQKLCLGQYQSGNAMVTKQSLENCKILLGEIVSQQAMVEDTTGQSNVLTTYCLTDDDKQFVAHSTTQHTDNYQELLDTCRERVLLLEQRELTWQCFPVAEAIAVQELVEGVNEAINIEFSEDTMAADMYGYLEQLEELETKQEENENAVEVIDTALDKDEVEKASQENPDINEEKDRLLAEFAASKAHLKEKLARVKAQVKAVTQLEEAIDRLEACINDHRAVVMSDLPVGAILEAEHEKLKENGVYSQTELASSLENLDTVLMQFNQPESEMQIRMPPDLNQRVENLKEACPELLEAGDEWPTKVEDSLAEWMDLKADIEMLTGWIATAESEFGSIQNIPKFLMDFNALEDRFQIHADNLKDQEEKYTAFITAIRPHLDSTEEVVVPFTTKVNKLSQRWDTLNRELGELEQAMVPWRQLLDARDALEHFMTPLEEMFEVECANANQLPPGSDLTPFIVQFKDSLRRINNSENLLSDLQETVEVNLTEEVYKKHASARKLHQIYEQLVTRWNDLKTNLNDMLESIQLKADEWMKHARESIECREANAEELANVKEELRIQTEKMEELENRLATLPPNPIFSDDAGPCCKVLIILCGLLMALLLFLIVIFKEWSPLVFHWNNCGQCNTSTPL